MASYVIDGKLALDAGSLIRALTFEQQRQVKAVILSHRHFDHTRDLATLSVLARNSDMSVDIYGIGHPWHRYAISQNMYSYLLDVRKISSRRPRCSSVASRP